MKWRLSVMVLRIQIWWLRKKIAWKQGRAA